MKILVLAGSPKGETSVTMRYVRYMEDHSPEDTFTVRHIVHEIRKLEQEIPAYEAFMREAAEADIILWAFPLYIMNVHSSYKRFIELFYERNARSVLTGKTAGVLTTSIHYHDDTAVKYLRAVCEDLGLSFADAHTPAMRDLLKDQGQKSLLTFLRSLKQAAKEKIISVPVNPPLTGNQVLYQAEARNLKLKYEGKMIVLADTLEGNIGRMVETFLSSFEKRPEVYTIADMNMKGPCLGCLKCGPKNICSYTGKDGYNDFYKTHIETADILIFAGELKDRYLSSSWKQFFDRSFFNTHHQKPMWGKHIGFILSGEYSRMYALQDFIGSFFEQMRCDLSGIVTDESGNQDLISSGLVSLARTLIQNASWQYIRPMSYAGIGGLKLFRDEIYHGLRIIFKADHKIYRKNGIYDFPNRNPLTVLALTLADLITRIPPISRGMMANMPRNMTTQYQKLSKPR